MTETARHRATFLGSDRLLARAVGRPLARFLHVEASGGILLLAATAAALVWAAVDAGTYERTWATAVRLDLGGTSVLDTDLHHVLNDGLMAVFFFVVGIEIKRELVVGQLASVRDAALPAVAALGGMVVPAGLYAVVNAGGAGADGWAIPMATDLAFALGVLALLGDRVPAGLKVLLLALAIVDDIGAILVIAVFYADAVEARWLVAAGVGLVLVVLLRRARVWYLPVYVAVGVAVWYATFRSGVHATIAGVALGLLAPARPLMADLDADAVAGQLSPDVDVTASEVRDVGFRIRESVSISERIEEELHPWTSYLIVPLFALGNAGVALSSDTIADAASSAITGGIFLGLVMGKIVGISAAVALAVRLGVGRLPEGVRFGHIVGIAGLGGIGFTVSLFVTDLAFGGSEALAEQAKVGVLGASALAAVLGSAVLVVCARRPAG